MNNLYHTRIVQIGQLPMGGDYPVRLQSMTSTNTMDTQATVEQSIRMIEAGCEYVRITAPGIKEAENLRIIKKELCARGYDTPLIADIHYQPKAALIAARYVEKIRINPGNYVDRKRGRIKLSETEYVLELEKIRERMKPLIDVCSQYGTALRIGSNHGSLSERILMRFGDTPEGMVESALEFIHICEDLDFRELVISMKASNVKVMVHANRLLVSRMQELGMDYPIHLGVTEAGDAEEGRMKSAAGIAPLLWDGIGDTIRVSLTEDPEWELPVARQLVAMTRPIGNTEKRSQLQLKTITPRLEYSRALRNKFGSIGGGQPPVVIVHKTLDANFNADFKPDYFFNPETQALEPNPIQNPTEESIPINMIQAIGDIQAAGENGLLAFRIHPDKFDPTALRNWFQEIKNLGKMNPVILHLDLDELEPGEQVVSATGYMAEFLVEGLVDGIWLESKKTDPRQCCEISFGMLQACGERISKTEYIACPSCGRTLFNIQSTLQVIKKRTSQLKGLKIGVMGCCVNGPGEMADAHYGYVGAGKGKITLYKGKQIMKIGIPEEFAVDELIRLIKENGDWQ